MTISIFGYGSLINVRSAQRALADNLALHDLVPVTLTAFRRIWNAKEQLYFEFLQRQATGLFLNIVVDPASEVSGVLIPVSARELEQLKVREKNYQCIKLDSGTLNADTLNADTWGDVYTFVARPEFLLRDDDADVYIPQKYIELVEAGCNDFGAEFLQYYRDTTEKSTTRVMSGEYRFVDPEQAQYV